jgi:hypothetical protein
MKNCPKCKASWKGEAIPKSQQKLYSATHFERQIGIDGGYMGIYDGIVAYQCPDCNSYSPRSNQPWDLEMFEKFNKKLLEG